MDLADDVRQAIERAGWLRSSQEGGPSLLQAAYYNAELYFEETRPPRNAHTERGVPTWGTSATSYSVAFDSTGSYSEYSMSTSPPSINGVEPLQLQRPMVSDHVASWLPCEFMKLTGCSIRFRLEDKNEWIDHITNEHLAECFPLESICWFCDEVRFKSHSKRSDDRRQQYRKRMDHIADHFRHGGETAASIRPDFFFLDHLHKNGLIEEVAFQQAKLQGELPAGYMPHDHYDNAESPLQTVSYKTAEANRLSSSRHSSQKHRSSRPRH